MPKPYDQDCPVARTLDIIGDRWTLLVIRDLFFGKTRFQQFLAASPGLPPKLLSDRLKKLELHNLIERAVYRQHPLRAEYRLTDKGLSLGPLLKAVAQWGLENCFQDQPEPLAAIAQQMLDLDTHGFGDGDGQPPVHGGPSTGGP